MKDFINTLVERTNPDKNNQNYCMPDEVTTKEEYDQYLKDIKHEEYLISLTCKKMESNKIASDLLYDLGMGLDPEFDSLIIKIMKDYAKLVVEEKIKNKNRQDIALDFAKSLVCANPEYIQGNISAPVPDYVMKLSFEYADAFLNAL